MCNRNEISSLFIDNAKEIVALESKCEELRSQITCLTKQKEDAFEEIEHLKDQVKFYYLDTDAINFIICNVYYFVNVFLRL